MFASTGVPVAKKDSARGMTMRDTLIKFAITYRWRVEQAW